MTNDRKSCHREFGPAASLQRPAGSNKTINDKHKHSKSNSNSSNSSSNSNNKHNNSNKHTTTTTTTTTTNYSNNKQYVATYRKIS